MPDNPAVRFSAYLSVYNDWDILDTALASVAPYVDELVIVDGAYRWMVPYLDPLGIDTERSDARVLDAALRTGMAIRLLTGVWENELEKRMAGYRACSNRYVMRLDADEVVFLDAARLDAFLRSGAAVALMDMPEYSAPGSVMVPAGTTDVPRQALLFDRDQTSAEAHLHCLWLVTGPEPLPEIAAPPHVSATPIAFNAHLTSWRTPDTSIARGAFYLLNFYRTHGLPAPLRRTGDAPDNALATLFAQISPTEFRDSLLTCPHVVNIYAAAHPFALRQTPLAARHEAAFTYLHERYLASLAALNRDTAAHGRTIASGQSIRFDLSTPAATDALARGGRIAIRFSHPIEHVTATMRFLIAIAPFDVQLALDCLIERDCLTVDIGSLAGAPQYYIRRSLELDLALDSPSYMNRLELIR